MPSHRQGWEWEWSGNEAGDERTRDQVEGRSGVGHARQGLMNVIGPGQAPDAGSAAQAHGLRHQGPLDFNADI